MPFSERRFITAMLTFNAEENFDHLEMHAIATDNKHSDSHFAVESFARISLTADVD